MTSSFRFLHAADLHLDSPLVGLAGKSAEFAQAVEHASRRAFDNLIQLAIDERCRFVVLAGDLFDGDLRDFQTGRFFLAGMARLKAAGIQAFVILGNHDAENRFADKLDFAENVHRFDHRKAGSHLLDDIGVVVHGQSFGQRDVLDNLALAYPAPDPDRFNIGVLHTACAGREGPHMRYAPCTIEQLVNHGYQYWALGHVHGRAVLHEHPHVVYPGNLQGRHAREVGPKGATLVEVADGRVVDCRPVELDEVRWAAETVDLEGATERREVLRQVQEQLTTLCDAIAPKPLALRLLLEGSTALHGELLLRPSEFREDLEALLATLPIEIWLETVDVRTRPPRSFAALDPTVSGSLETEVRRLSEDPATKALLEACLTEIQVKMPAGARQGELFARLRETGVARAADLALSLVSETEPALAPQ